METSPDSMPPGWEEAIPSSPETLPPGFENPTRLSSLTSSPQENPSNLLSFAPSSSPHERQTGTSCPRSSPSSSFPQEIQEISSPFSHPLSTPLEKPVPGPSFLPPPQQKTAEAVHHPPCQPQEGEGPLPSTQKGNISFHNPFFNSLPEMGQMVCGSCSELLSYPRGSKYIRCACCQTVNFVFEAHQVGVVKCGKCSILVMYPYASKSLRCSSCHHVTDIGPHNIRPPVSEMQGFSIPL